MTRFSPRGVLFDMDGVLIFSTDAWFAVYNDTLTLFGHAPIGREEFLKIFGNGTQADRAAYMPERSVEEIDAAYRRFFADRLDRIRLNPEAPEALERLRRRGIATSLATNTNRRLAESILGRLGIAHLLAAFACADEAGAGKPNPAVVRLAAERLGLPLADCLFVGDSRYDEEAARAAPVAFAGYRYGAAPTRIEALSEVAG
ncbi:MAG TPA: HAD family phosphatase [Thermoanaerobaculia bacterium]|nr:HAD family phosphatase [Thermoanaerobaculia bacterium]